MATLTNGRCGLSFVVLCMLSCLASSEHYYVIPSYASDVDCPFSFCLTLSELSANTSYYIKDNMTILKFQPGNHSLENELTVSSISDFRMLSNDTFSVNIKCGFSSRFTIYRVSAVEINGLNFFDCGHISIFGANNVSIRNSRYERLGDSSTALVLKDTVAVTIQDCYFIYNLQRKNNSDNNIDENNYLFHLDPSLKSHSDKQSKELFGGALLISFSHTTIDQSTFDGNEAVYGGAIFAELNSSVVINDCTFHDNGAVREATDIGSECSGGGGAMFVNNSRVEIYNSTFTNNYLSGNLGCNSSGGALIAMNSEISIEETDFIHNKVTGGKGSGGAIYVSNSTLLTISVCNFSENKAHIAGVMYIHSSNATINQSQISRNVGHDWTGAISITENSHASFNNCSFTDNTARTLGGALYISSSPVTINSCQFKNNNVEEVAAVMAITEQSYVTVSLSSLSGNRATMAVISVYSSNVTFANKNEFSDNQGSLLAFNSSVRLEGETKFLRCTSLITDLSNRILQEGGAVTAYSSLVVFQNSTIFIQNSAKYGGALFAVESNILFAEDTEFSLEQLSTEITNNTATISGGGIYLYHSSFTTRQSFFFITGNDAKERGGAVHAVNSDILLEHQSRDKNHSFVLAKNIAQLGGGFYLEVASKLLIPSSVSSIKLSENVADYGAAIYVDDNTIFDTCFTTSVNVTPASECFVNILDTYSVIDKDKGTMENSTNVEHSIITLDNNQANVMGSNLFGGLLDRCRPNTLSSDIGITLLSGTIVEHDDDGLTFFLNISNIDDEKSISSNPTQVCFCVDGKPICDLREHQVVIRKGEIFNISIVAVDQVKKPVESKIFSTLTSTESDLVRGRRALIANQCTNISYSILSPHNSESVTLFADGPCRDATPSLLKISANFSACDCPIGFEHTANDSSCECVCDSLISEYIENCNEAEKTFVRKSSSWISHVLEGNQSTYVICQRCPFRYCQGPSDSIQINLNSDTGSNIQCTEGHSGTICGVCAPNFSVSLAHKRCLHCPDNWYVLFIVTCVGTVLAGLALVISILAINFTVAVGTINGFIFYANIVDVYDSTFLPLGTSSFPVLIIEWLNLDPGIDICFVKGIDLYGHTWIRLIFPAYIILIVIVIIIISEHSIRFSKLIGKRNPISTLATLIYLSFTNILETAVVSLRPTTLTYINYNGSRQETVWLPDGDLKYFKGKHIPLFLVAVILVLLKIVYIFLLISWQWLITLSNFRIFKWTKNQKLQNFMEAYNAPYCDKHRYWTGLLLLVRVILILISITTEGSRSSIPLFSTIFVLGVIFLLKTTYIKKLYKQWPVEVLETVMIFNLFLYAISLWFAQDKLETRRIIAYISTSITFVLILIVLAYHVYAYLLISAFPKLKTRGLTMTKIRAMTAVSLPSSRPSISLDTHDRGDDDDDDDDEDRFREMVGTMSVPASRVWHAQNLDIQTVLPTSSVLETPYWNAGVKEGEDSDSNTVSTSFTTRSI